SVGRSRLSHPIARSGERRDNAVQGAQLLLGAMGALEKVADVAHHARPLLDIAQETVLVELLLEMLEETLQLLLGRGLAVAGPDDVGRRRVAGGEPLVADEQHR